MGNLQTIIKVTCLLTGDINQYVDEDMFTYLYDIMLCEKENWCVVFVFLKCKNNIKYQFTCISMLTDTPVTKNSGAI